MLSKYIRAGEWRLNRKQLKQGHAFEIQKPSIGRPLDLPHGNANLIQSRVQLGLIMKAVIRLPIVGFIRNLDDQRQCFRSFQRHVKRELAKRRPIGRNLGDRKSRIDSRFEIDLK